VRISASGLLKGRSPQNRKRRTPRLRGDGAWLGLVCPPFVVVPQSGLVYPVRARGNTAAASSHRRAVITHHGLAHAAVFSRSAERRAVRVWRNSMLWTTAEARRSG
jgi:hypothetical protein